MLKSKLLKQNKIRANEELEYMESLVKHTECGTPDYLKATANLEQHREVVKRRNHEHWAEFAMMQPSVHEPCRRSLNVLYYYRRVWQMLDDIFKQGLLNVDTVPMERQNDEDLLIYLVSVCILPTIILDKN